MLLTVEVTECRPYEVAGIPPRHIFDRDPQRHISVIRLFVCYTLRDYLRQLKWQCGRH